MNPDETEVRLTGGLLLRLFQYFYYDDHELEDDEVNEIAQTIIELGSDGATVTEDDYDYIVGDEAIDGTDDTDYSDNDYE